MNAKVYNTESSFYTLSKDRETLRLKLTPDAMNQTIYEMLTSQESSRALSYQISSLYSIGFSGSNFIGTKPRISIFSLFGSMDKSNPSLSSNFSYMPHPLPWRAMVAPDSLLPDYAFLTESCASKAVVGVFGGAVCGLLMGVFLGAMSDIQPPMNVVNGKEIPQTPLREQIQSSLRLTGEKCIYWSRNFAFITAVFGGSDCLVEKYRASHDVWNSVISGCITGAAMQAKQGPHAAAVGCGGFATFSLIIDKIMGSHL